MTEAPNPGTADHLVHQYRTPVNHIMGYSNLLIEEAGDRHLEPFVPALNQIHEGGRRLLESIQRAFGQDADPGGYPDGKGFRADLTASASDISEALTSLVENLEFAHSQTLADLDLISGAIQCVLVLAEREVEAIDANPLKPIDRIEDSSHDDDPASWRRVGGRILIAEDDAASRDLLRRELEREGHQIVEARDGAEALALLVESPCDLVLLDIVMPVMDGFQTLASIRQDARLRELPVIMVSALDEMRGVVRCIEAGAEDYLPKPYSRVLLRARIGASLEKKYLRDRERRRSDELERTLHLLEQVQEQLSEQASRDALTGLANRRSVEAQLDFRIGRATPFTAIYVDLNGFKKVNEAYGHAVGDDLLKQVGSRLLAAFRLNDLIGRWGDDEFVVLIDVGASAAEMNISRIMKCFAEAFVSGEGGSQHCVKIAAAAGIAAWNPGETATDLLHRADLAMYAEKLRDTG